jgi:hypothetical protein
MEVRSDYPLPSPLRLDLGTVDNTPQHSDRARTARDHLKIYYSDFLRVPTAHGLAYMDQKESLVDCEELLAWTAQAQPRSRVDAFPLLAICRDLLSRMSKKELKLSSRRIKELEAELAQAHATIEVQAAELNELRAGHVRANICCIDSPWLPYTRKAHQKVQGKRHDDFHSAGRQGIGCGRSECWYGCLASHMKYAGELSERMPRMALRIIGEYVMIVGENGFLSTFSRVRTRAVDSLSKISRSMGNRPHLLPSRVQAR